MENTRTTNIRSRIGRLIGLIFGLGLFCFVLYQLGPEQVLNALVGLNGWYILAACGMFAVSYAIKIGKWYFMQRKAGLNRSLLSVAHLYFGTRVGGLITPMRSGEFIPGLFVEEKGEILAITFFDRIIESTQTLLTFVVVFALFAYRFVPPAGMWPLVLFILVIGLLCLPFFFPERSSRWILSVLNWLGQNKLLGRARWFVRLQTQARDVIQRFFEVATRFFSPPIIVLLFVVTFIGWLFDILVAFFIFQAVGIFLGVTMVMISMMTLAMVNFIAPTPSGLGIGDASLALIIGSPNRSGETGAFLIVVRLFTASLTALCYVALNRLDS